MKKSQIRKLIPKVPDLRRAHKALITADVTDRVIALRTVMDWFDVYTTLVRSQVIAAGGQRKLDLAAKIKPLAARHDTPAFEAETALIQAIRMLESALAPAVPTLKLPRINDAWAEYESKKIALEHKAAKAIVKFAALKAGLDQFFKPLGLTFKFSKDLPKPRQFDATGRVLYSFDYAGTLVQELKANGLDSVLMGQAPAILKAASLSVSNGKLLISMAKLMDLLPGLLVSIYGLGASSKSTSTPATAPPATPKATPTPNPTPTTPKPPKATPAPPIGGLSPEAAKYFRAGTQQLLFDRLIKVAGGRISMADLYDGLSAGDPRRMILSIHQKGVKLGLWEANRYGKMVHFDWTGGPHV